MEKVAVLITVRQPGVELPAFAAGIAEDEGYRVVVSDDGSGPEYDGVFAMLPDSVLLTRLPAHSGKGSAIKNGLREILRQAPDVCGVITLDSCGEHTLRNLAAAAEALRERTGAILLGARTFTLQPPFKSRLGNLLVRLAFSGACSVKLTDPQTDLRAFPIELVAPLTGVPGERYEYATNVLLWAARNDLKIMEVPLPDPYSDVRIPAHFHPVRDSIRIFERIFKFAFASFSGFCVDYVTVLWLKALTTPALPESFSLFISVLVGRLLSGTVSFTINRKMGLRVEDKVGRAALKYFTILFALMAVNYWLLYLVHLLLRVPLWLAKMLVETTMFFVNYALQTRLVFRKKKKAVSGPELSGGEEG